MRGIFSQKTQIRNEIFTEIARLAYEGGGIQELEDLPYTSIPGEIATYRDSIFLERAIVSEIWQKQELESSLGNPRPQIIWC